MASLKLAEFCGYIALYLNPSEPQRLRFVVTPDIYDALIDHDVVTFCQGVVCDTDKEYERLRNDVKALELEYMAEFIERSKLDAFEPAFERLLQTTIARAHAVATGHPWHAAGRQ